MFAPHLPWPLSDADLLILSYEYTGSYFIIRGQRSEVVLLLLNALHSHTAVHLPTRFVSGVAIDSL